MRLSVLNILTRSRLRNKFILFFIVLACVPVLVLGGILLYLIDLAHRQDVSNLELQVIEEKVEQTEKFFADTLGLLELRVEAIELTELEQFGISGQESLAQDILESNPSFEEVSFINLTGKEVVKVSRFNKESELLYVSELPNFKEARTGSNFIGEVHHTLAGPMVTLAAPVRIDNAVVQILSAEVNLSALTRSIESARLGTSGYVTLFDKNGTFISHQRRGKIAPGFDASTWIRVGRVLSGEKLDGLDKRDRYVSLFDSEPVIGAGKKIPEIGWALLVEWPVADADAVITDVRNQVVLVTLASIIAVLFLAPIFSSRLVHPIRQLQKSAIQIEKGELDAKVDIRTNDELGELGGSFNKMIKGLKRLQELREEFVFVAAHELRSPVTVIKGYTSMILEGDAGPVKQKMKTFLEEIQQANERLLKLVEDLLEVARSEAGRIEITTKPIDLQKPIRLTLQEIEQLAKEKFMSVVYEEFDGLPQVQADERRIKEIMVNLVGNAIKYTPEKGKIRIFHEVKENEVITHVEDNGFGIDKEAQKKIFQKFYRVQTDETRDISGTGLGLFIVKELVQKMQGRIWFTSEKGRGTTFSFALQRVD